MTIKALHAFLEYVILAYAEKKTFIFVWKIKVLDQSMLSLISTFELTNLKYDKVMIQVNIFFVQKIPFQVSVMVFVSSMLFPDTGGGDVPVPSSMLFPDSGFEILRGPPPFSIR